LIETFSYDVYYNILKKRLVYINMEMNDTCIGCIGVALVITYVSGWFVLYYGL